MEKQPDEVTKKQLITDFKVLVADAEALLKATANQGGEELAQVRAKAEESLRVVKTRLTDAQAELLLKTKEAAKVADAYVHDNPWQAVGFAAGFGLLVGLLSRHR